MTSIGASFAGRVRAGKRVVGTFVKLPSLESVDLIARVGLDFCIVDAEHSQLTRGETSALVRHADSVGLPVLVRLPVFDAGEVNRILEAGAAGVQLSSLRTAAAARSLRSSMRYPPEGTRSASLAQPAAGYGARSLVAYLEAVAADPPLVVGQIETATTDDPLHEVVAPLDVVFVGTTDLSVDLGVPGDLGHPTVTGRIAELATATSGRVLGAWVPTAREARNLASDATYLVVGSDLQFLQQRLTSLGDELGIERSSREPPAPSNGGRR